MRRRWPVLVLAAVVSLVTLSVRGYGAERVTAEQTALGRTVLGQTAADWTAVDRVTTEQRTADREVPAVGEMGDEQSEILSRLDLEEIESYLRGSGQRDFPGLGETMEKLAAGQIVPLAKEMLGALGDSLFAEIAAGGRLIGQILLLGILSAVFSNFSGAFQNSQISETGFFVTYLLLFAFLTAGMTTGTEVASETVTEILGFMKVLMPAYFLAVAFSGASVSAAAMYEATIGVMTLGQWLLHTLLIPMVRVYLILAMAGNLMKENRFSRMTGLLEQAVGWGIKTLLGIVVGIQLLQTMVLPYVDSLKNGTMQKVVGLIPGIGQGMSAVTQMVLGSGVLIRNTLGAASVVILLGLMAVPVIKLLVLALLYQWTAALMEPVCDKRTLACVTAAAASYRMLLKIMTAAAFLLILTVAVVCAGTNAVYYS